jgi:hypothetical protein
MLEILLTSALISKSFTLASASGNQLGRNNILRCGYGNQRRLHFHQGEVDVLF